MREFSRFPAAAAGFPTQPASPNLRHVMDRRATPWPDGRMGTYEIGHIEPEQIDRAFALVRVAHPAVQLGAWRRYATDVLDRVPQVRPRRDIVVACNGLGYVQGLGVTLLADLADRRVLDVPILIIASAGDEKGVRAELVDHLSARAAGYGCSALRIWTQMADNWRHHLTPEAAQEAPIDLSISVTRG